MGFNEAAVNEGLRRALRWYVETVSEAKKVGGLFQHPLEPKWWNGRHASLRSWCSQGRPGSTPGFGTTTSPHPTKGAHRFIFEPIHTPPDVRLC